MTRCSIPVRRPVCWPPPAEASNREPGAAAVVPSMAPAPNPGPTVTTATAAPAPVGLVRLSAVAAPQIAALGLMLATETDLVSRAGFLLSWSILNFFWLALLRRPA